MVYKVDVEGARDIHPLYYDTSRRRKLGNPYLKQESKGKCGTRLRGTRTPGILAQRSSPLEYDTAWH